MTNGKFKKEDRLLSSNFKRARGLVALNLNNRKNPKSLQREIIGLQNKTHEEIDQEIPTPEPKSIAKLKIIIYLISTQKK